MNNKKVFLRLPKVLENPRTGVMEYCSVDEKGINPLAITPVLRLVAPKSHLSVTKADTAKLIEMVLSRAADHLSTMKPLH